MNCFYKVIFTLILSVTFVQAQDSKWNVGIIGGPNHQISMESEKENQLSRCKFGLRNERKIIQFLTPI